MNASAIERTDIHISILLALTAGYTDTVGFVALFGLFTAHVTGNFVVLGAALANHGHGLIIKFMALPMFIICVSAARLIERYWFHRGKRADIPLLLIQAGLLIAFLSVGVRIGLDSTPDSAVVIMAGMLGVAAMSFQNMSSRAIFVGMTPTTVMTGNVTQMVIDVTDLLTRTAGQERSAALARLQKMWLPVLSFALGALFGGLAYVTWGFYCLIIPVVAILSAVILCLKK